MPAETEASTAATSPVTKVMYFPGVIGLDSSNSTGAALTIASAERMPTAIDETSSMPRTDMCSFPDIASRRADYTILNESTNVHRRSRVKLIGEVIPSPVGLAMVNEV
jgi:hypothetical protein